MARKPPAAFVAELVRRFGAGHDVQFNELTSRWEVITPSAGGKPVAQVWGWFRRFDAKTQRYEPVPMLANGLPPFRDLDSAAQQEIIANMEHSFVGNREDGASSWKEHIRNRSEFNAQRKAKSRRRRAETYAELLGEVRIAGRWKKEHPRNTGPKMYSTHP